MSHNWHIGGSESIYDEQKMDGVPRIIKTSSEIEMNNLHQNNPKHTIKHVFTALIQQKIRIRNSKLNFLLGLSRIKNGSRERLIVGYREYSFSVH